MFFFSLGYLALAFSFYCDGLPSVLTFQLGFQGFKWPNGWLCRMIPFCLSCFSIFTTILHHLLQLYIMMQLHNMSYIMINIIYESSHSSLSILLNISSNHNKFHLLEVLINTLCTLTQTL